MTYLQHILSLDPLTQKAAIDRAGLVEVELSNTYTGEHRTERL